MRQPNVKLDGTMSTRQIADTLDAIVFTAAHGWQYAVSIDEDVRDLLVDLLHKTYLFQPKTGTR